VASIFRPRRPARQSGGLFAAQHRHLLSLAAENVNACGGGLVVALFAAPLLASVRTKKTIFHKQAKARQGSRDGNLIFGASRLVTPFLIQLPFGSSGRAGWLLSGRPLQRSSQNRNNLLSAGSRSERRAHEVHDLITKVGAHMNK